MLPCLLQRLPCETCGQRPAGSTLLNLPNLSSGNIHSSQWSDRPSISISSQPPLGNIGATYSQEVVKGDISSTKKGIINCFEHQDTEQLYCKSCKCLICFKCAYKGGKHHEHNHHLLDEAFERYKGEVTPSLELMEMKLVAVKEALAMLDKRCEEISDQREAIEADMHDTFERLQETLYVRKTRLIGQLHEITQRKLKDLAIQRDQMETILAQLSSCLDFVSESLKTDSQGEVLIMMKTNIMNQVKELTSPFQPDVLKPNEEADMKFTAS